MNAWLVLSAVVLLAVSMVMLPVGLAVASHYRRRKLVKCPLTAEQAVIRVDALAAGIDAAFGRRRRVVAECTRWPDAMCRNACVAHAEAMQDAPRLEPARV